MSNDLDDLIANIANELNEDMTICDKSSISAFHRIIVADKHLEDILKIEPTIILIAIRMRNNSYGCWLAFTSHHVARRIADVLIQNGFVIEVDKCGCDGEPVCYDHLVTEPRPWHGNNELFSPEPAEFFYCIAQYGDTVRAYFVPRSYWNEKQEMFDGCLGIESLIKRRLTRETDSIYQSEYGELANIKHFLDSLGFRENLLFQSYVNAL